MIEDTEDTTILSLACAWNAHHECEGGEPDEVGDYGTRYGWHDCNCACHVKGKK